MRKIKNYRVKRKISLLLSSWERKSFFEKAEELSLKVKNKKGLYKIDFQEKNNQKELIKYLKTLCKEEVITTEDCKFLEDFQVFEF